MKAILLMLEFDGGLREQTPPSHRRGPSPSMGAQKLRGAPHGSPARSGTTDGVTTVPSPRTHHVPSIVNSTNSSQLHRGDAPHMAVSAVSSTDATTSLSPRLQACNGEWFVFVPTVEHMVALQQQQQPPPSSPESKSAKDRHRYAIAATGMAGPVVTTTTSSTSGNSKAANRLFNHDSVTKAVDQLFNWLAVVPRFAPHQALECLRVLERITQGRADVESTLVQVRTDMSVLGKQFQMLQSKNQALIEELRRVTLARDAANDLAVAADAHLIRVHETLRTLHDEKKHLGAEFEKKLFEMTHVGQPQARTLASEFRTAEVARVERECDELRAQLAKRETWIVERGALVESLARCQEEKVAAQRSAGSMEGRVSELESKIAALKASNEAAAVAFMSERLALSKELEERRRQRSTPHQTSILSKVMEERAQAWTRRQTFSKWRESVIDRQIERSMHACVAEKQMSELALEGRQLKLKEEKAIVVRELTRLTHKVDEQMLQISALQVELRKAHRATEKVEEELRRVKSAREFQSMTRDASFGPLKQSVVVPEENEALSSDVAEASMVAVAHGSGPTSLIDIAHIESNAKMKAPPQDPQVQALKAYHMLSTVLQGVKRRLSFESLRIPPLPVAERRSEPVPSIVFHWIQDVFQFVHHIMSIEDRLLKAKVKLTFLAVQLKPSIKRVAAQMSFASSDAPRLHVLREQLNGYVEIQQAIKSLRGHIDATHHSLLSSSDPKKHDQISLLTNTFEADIGAFLDRVEKNKRKQFQFELQLVKLREAKADLLHRLLGGKASPTSADGAAMPRTGSASSSGRGSPVSGASPPPALQSTHPKAAKHGTPVSLHKQMPQGPVTRKPSIGELLPTLKRFTRPDSVGSWAPQESRPMTAEVLRNQANEEAATGDHHHYHDSDQEEAGEGHYRRGSPSPPPLSTDMDIPTAQGDPDFESGQPSGDRNLGTIEMSHPVVDALRKGASPHVMHRSVDDPWNERKKEGWRISSIMKAGPDGRLDVKDFLKLTKEASLVSQSIRRSLDSEMMILAKSKKRHQQLKPRTSVVGQRSLGNATTSTQESSLVTLHSSTNASAENEGIPMRDNLTRPSATSVNRSIKDPSQASDELVELLMPRHGAQKRR